MERSVARHPGAVTGQYQPTSPPFAKCFKYFLNPPQEGAQRCKLCLSEGLKAFPSVHTLSPFLPHPHPMARSLAVLQLGSARLQLLFLRVDQDKDRDCSLDCPSSSQKPLCASDGRTFLSRCEFQRAKCKDPQLEIAHRGNCKDVSRCVAERKYTQEQARKEFQQVFIPECNDDGTYSQVQCHSYTGYCWCVTPNGRPISGTAVAHKTPRCPGSINEKLPQREGTGKADDAAAPALETQPQGDEEDIASRYPTLWTEQVKSRQNKTNKNSASSCDQEHQSALEEAKQPKNDNVVIPECAHGGLYKPVQCHPSTGYCWCVLVDTGRPIPGTSTRYEQPKCDNTARAHPAKARDLYKNRPLQ
ncbi:hypothetical protein A6R68_03081, partial [Neotoma lepida]